MKLFSKTLTVFQIIFLIFASLAGAKVTTDAKGKWGSMNSLKKVHSHLMNNGHIVRLEFKKPVTDWVEPLFYEKSVQIDFPGAFVAPSKKSFPAESSAISKVFASQFDKETLRIRFHIQPDASDIEERFKLVSQGRFIVVRFDTSAKAPTRITTAKAAPVKVEPAKAKANPVKKQKTSFVVMDDDQLSRFLSRASEKIKSREEEKKFHPDANAYTATAKEKEPVEEVAEIKVNRAGMGVTPLVNQIKKAALSDTGAETKNSKPKKSKSKITSKENTGFSLKDSRPTGKPMEIVPSSMKMISMFAVVLGLMFLTFFGFKKYVLKNTAFGGGNKLVNVLGTWFLGPKKNIALVEVAGEVLVLGMSQENITLLSSITSEEKIEEIKNASNKGKGPLNLTSDRTESGTDRKQTVASQAAGQFSSYLSKFSKPQETKEQVMDNAREQILQKIGKLKTAKA